MVRRIIALAVLLCIARPAAADHWYEGPVGHRRVLHITLTATGGVAQLTYTLVLSDLLGPDSCRWCNPPGFDTSARNALVWADVDRARTLSDLGAGLAMPLVALAAVAPVWFDDPAPADIIDTGLPIAESAVMAQLLTTVIKVAVARERPYRHFGPPTASTSADDFFSFPSGHTSFTFAVATSAGMVAHQRHLRAEPLIWAVGLPVAATTGYLRIAGDKHYLSDVLVGATIGTGAGLAIPLLLAHDLAVVSTGTGAVVVGQF